jgi:putative peptide zinc metalloprotease protein
MNRSLFSSSWYRIADLKPRLRGHTAIHRQVFRSNVWYILQDHQTGRFHSLSPMANLMLCLMDGRRTMREIWEAVGRKAGDDPPTQDETIQLLAQLHGADLLQGEIPPDFDEMVARSEKASRRRMMQQLRNPMAVRVPLFDPDRLLDLTMPFLRPLFTVPGFLVWLALVVTGVVLAVIHWPELASDVSDRALATQNVAVILCVYPFVKSLHELGHAYATKRWGGEVHEIGVMLLVFVPVLYVDASASAAFSQKRRRIIVGAAGILVEMALAALATIVWLHGSPGLGRTVAFNVMLIGGVSTLLFNGNPLLRFDGYYIFSDLIEIPNLGSRANAYFFYLLQRHLFNIDDVETPVVMRSEAKWLLAYAVLAFAYRMLVWVGIALFLTTRFVFVGLVMVVWAVGMIAVVPAFKGVKFLATSPRLRGQRRRAFAVVGGLAAAAVTILFLIPLPYSTVAEGVIIAPDQAEVRAKTDGFVTKVVATPGDFARAHQTLIAFADPILEAKVAVIEAQLDETNQRLDAVKQLDRVQAKMFAEQAADLAERLKAARKQQGDLTVSSNQGGRFLMASSEDEEDMPGRFVRRGELLGYVIGNQNAIVLVLAAQGDVDLIRQPTTAVEAYLAKDPSHSIAARILREAPAAQQNVPSLALTTQGGGSIALNPATSQRPQTLFSFFQLDVELQEPIGLQMLGSRVYVRFKYRDEPVAWRMMRSLRQFFLGQFRV